MQKINFLARAFGKATEQAMMNWGAFKETVERVAASGKPESFVLGTKRGFVRVEITTWETHVKMSGEANE